MQDRVRFKKTMQSQALKKGKLHKPETREPWNKDCCIKPRPRYSLLSMRMVWKTSTTYQGNSAGGSRWLVCACMGAYMCICIRVCRCSTPFRSNPLKSYRVRSPSWTQGIWKHVAHYPLPLLKCVCILQGACVHCCPKPVSCIFSFNLMLAS